MTIMFVPPLRGRIEVAPEDREALRVAGDDYFAGAISALSLPVTYLRPSRVKRLQATLHKERQRWNWRFGETAEARIQEQTLADVLEWGRGAVECRECSDLFPAATLRREEARIDGVYRRRFFCPAGHLIWIIPENVLGEINVMPEAEYEWRPLRRTSPWLSPG